MDALVLAVAAQFGLGEVVSVGRPTYGGPEVRLVTTEAGSFVLKHFDSPWHAELCDVVADHLNARGVRQARLFRTVDGRVVTRDGYSVQERLPGEVFMSPSPEQHHAVFAYLARHDSALADLAVPAELGTADTVWTRTASAEYLLANLFDLLGRHQGATLQPGPIADALAALAEALPTIASLPAQLVHGDVGSDNVLLDGSNVAVVDFTPYHQPALFALGTALYWYFVHGKPDGIDLAGIRSALGSYAECRSFTSAELSVLPAMVLRESLRRLAVPLALGGPSGRGPGSAADLRYAAAVAVAAALPELVATCRG